MVCSCGWGHPRPRCTYRGLGQSPSGNSSLLPTLYALRSTRGLGQSPSGNYSRHTGSTLYRSRRRDCFTSDFERFDVMPRRLTDYHSLLRVRRDVIIEFCFNIIPTTGGSAFGSGPRASQTKTRATGQDFAELITPHGFERGGWRANAENETRQNITTGVRFPFVKSHPECGIQSEFRVQNCPAKTYALQKSSLQRLLGSRHLK